MKKSYDLPRIDEYSTQSAATSTEELLEQVPLKNPLAMLTTFSLAFIWLLAALTTLAPTFMAPTEIENGTDFVSIQMDFNLPSRIWFLDASELTASIYFLGNLVFGQIFCVAADRIGRRPVLIWCLLISGVAGVVGTFSPSYNFLLATRFVQGSFFTTMVMVNWVLCTESVAMTSHATASILFGVLWVVGYCAVVPIALISPTWRYIQLISSMPSLICGLILAWTLPESVSFLISKGKVKETLKWIERYNWLVDTKISGDVDYIIANETASAAPEFSFFETIGHVIKSKTLMINMAIQTVIWLVDFYLYAALALGATKITENFYVQFLFSGLVELPCYIVIPFFLDRFGRRPSVIGIHVIGALTFALIYFMFLFNLIEEYLLIYFGLWLFAKFCMASAFMCCFVYGSEIFPVQYRNICLGIPATLSNIGAFMGPHSGLLDEIIGIPGIYNAAYAIFCVICAILTVFLPETKH